MRPGIVRVESKSVPKPSSETGLQRVVAGYQAVGVHADVSNTRIRSDRRSRKQTIHVAGRPVNMKTAITDIRNLNHRGSPKALLNVEIPLLRVGRLEVLRQRRYVG